ncbi:MAG: UTP--glucose-1-phosphate uridylyltransferase, partial [Planctomycetes bacterium]|nr:UTP--glucose-1-phosphate uridylyltransferase [Planctomycetota bacterium]
MPEYEEILALFKKHGQEHILSGWEKLFPEQQDNLLADCAQVDFTWLKARLAEFQAAQASSRRPKKIAPAPVARLPENEEETTDAAARAAGEELLKKGKAAAFLAAGGQGSRLGFEGPKGCFPIGPISGRSLFQWHGERIAARSRRCGAPIPWYIMTSQENDRETRRHFDAHGFFGLPEDDVFFFSQSMVPCLDFNGKLMLSSPASLAMNPDGHGGAISGFRLSGALDDMKERGIEVVSFFQVDNPLVAACDPLFLGRHVLEEAEMSSKVVRKNSPSERMGIACLLDGKPAVVEYIDLDEESMRAANPDGSLRFWAGSAAIH